MSLSRHLPRLSCNTILVVMAVLGTIFCVTTAFGLTVSVFPLILVTLISAAAFSLGFQEKKLFLVLLPALALVLILGSITGAFSALGPSLQQLSHDILSRFSKAYPNLSFAIPPEPEGYPVRNYTLLFSILAVILSFWLAWGVGYRSCLISVAGTLPFLLLCVIINDTPPHVAPLILLLSSWLTVLLARERVNEPDAMDAMRVSLILLSVLLLLSVVGTVYPKEDTGNRELPELLQELLDRLPGPMQDALSRESTGFQHEELGADTSEILDLTTQGVRDRKDTVMLQVSGTEPGVLYLRGAAKDVYTGSSWESRNDATIAQSVYAHTSIGTAFGSSYQAAVQITNLRERAKVAFTPYGFISCPGAQDITGDLRVPCSEDDYISYYWPGIATMDLTQTTDVESAGYDDYVRDTCLSLPEDVQRTLYDLAISHGYDPELSALDTVAWVAEFVRSNGAYELNVPRQPTNYDFAVYFLTESRAGYCVHFATATAAMLRALGMPARYASGYRVNVQEAGEVTDVTDQDTHAWAEVYFEGLGWIPIESTPGFGNSVSLPEVTHEQEPEPEPEEPSPEPSEVPQEPSEAPAAPQEPEQQPQAPTPPQPENPGSGSGHSPLRLLLLIPVLLALGLAFLFLRHSIILRRRARAFYSRNRNQAVIEQWAHLEKLSAWGAEAPDGLEALALKARFSQHEITPEELNGFTKVTRNIQGAVEGSLTPWQLLRFRWLHCLDLYRG